MKRPYIPKYLLSDCILSDKSYCDILYCPDAVKESPFGRWYITMGHAGYNSPANNGNGYSSQAQALIAMERYLRIITLKLKGI